MYLNIKQGQGHILDAVLYTSISYMLSMIICIIDNMYNI